jgi:hypothetical protein
MLYALLIYGAQEDWARTDRTNRQQRMDCHLKALQMEHDDGVLVVSARLQRTDSATTLRSTPQGIVVHDGPFAETKEQLGGLQILNCDSLDEVMKYVREFIAHGGTVEIRPIHPDPSSLD